MINYITKKNMEVAVMAQSTDLIVDEEQLKELATYITNSSYLIEKSIQSYLTVLGNIRNSGIRSGEIADSLDSFIAQAQRLKGMSNSVSRIVHNLISCYLSEIQVVDSFQF